MKRGRAAAQVRRRIVKYRAAQVWSRIVKYRAEQVWRRIVKYRAAQVRRGAGGVKSILYTSQMVI